MPVIALAHPSTCATSLMHVKNSTSHFCLWHLLSGALEQKKMKERTKTSNLTVDHFSLTFINLSLAWMLYLHVWLQNKRKFLVWSEYYSQFGIYQHSHIPVYLSFLEPQQNNCFSNPEAYSEPCQTPKMECIAKIVNG